MSRKFLLIVTGESFRCGNQGSRERGSIKSFNPQYHATTSQINFVKYIKSQYNIDCDIFCNLYKLSTEYDYHLTQWYLPYIKFLNFNEILLGEDKLHTQTIKLLTTLNIDIHKYEFILFIRADHFLKPYFCKIFNPNSIKLTFAHINEITDKAGNSYHIGDGGEPSVNHQILYVPKIFFTELLAEKFNKLHGSYYAAICNGINRKDITFFLHTYHSSSTDQTWNPIFHQVGREETAFWADRNYIVDEVSHVPIFVENLTIYDKLINNNFKDITN
jgi:hypothetical protein